MDHTTEAAFVFQAKVELQKHIDTSNTTVRGTKVEAIVEWGSGKEEVVDNVLQPCAGH